MLPVIEPVVPPAPTESVPAVTVVSPERVFVPVSDSTPAPSFRTEPEPLIEPAEVRASERLNTSVALSTMSPAIEPVVPPAPT